MKKSIYNIEIESFNDYSESLIYNTASGIVLKLNKSDFNNYFNSNFNSFNTGKLNYLIENGIILEEKTNELEKLISENKEFIKNSKNYNLIIAPSSNCQMGCDYCGQKHTSNKLNSKLEEQLINRINKVVNEYTLDTLSLTWYGGEPLIALNSIKKIIPEIRKIKKITSINQTIITNGVLLSTKVFNDLNNLGVFNYQITIDGDEKVHNERRPLKNTSNSFKIIYTNLMNIFNLDFFDETKHNINIRINVDKRNLTSVKTLLNKMAEDGFHKFINVSIAPVHSWENELNDIIEEKSVIAEVEIDLLIFMHKLGYNLNLIPNRVKNTCIMTSKAGELIDAFGNIYNCTEAPYTPKIMTDKKYLIGNLKQDIINQNNHLSNWFDIIEKNNEVPCTSCNLLPICGGACPKKWIDDKESPCPTFKHNIKDIVVLNYIKQQEI